MRVTRSVAALLVLASAAWSAQSSASTIVAPVTAVASSQSNSKDKDLSIGNTIDQSGLSLQYESGVTDFDSYFASKPEHTSKSDGNEWFSEDFKKSDQPISLQKLNKKPQNSKLEKRLSLKNHGVGNSGSKSDKRTASKSSPKNNLPQSSASSTMNANVIASIPLLSIIYDFKRQVNINGFLLWNEEFSGIATTELWSSTDGNSYALLKTITPEPSKFAKDGEVVPYLAQLFLFELTTMMYFKLLIYDCPGLTSKESKSNSCGIGEVAFSSVPSGPNNAPTVPVPAALPLLASALALYAWFGRRRAHNRI